MMASRRKPAAAPRVAAVRSRRIAAREAPRPADPPQAACSEIKAPRKRRPRFVL
jgi:hypothetical protein